MRPEQAVVVVTGGNDDIGLQLVTALFEAGHRVGNGPVRRELPMLASRFPHGILSYRCNVANRAAVRDVVKKVAAEWGRVDVLVNNAALAVFRPLTVGPIRGVPPTRCFLPALTKRSRPARGRAMHRPRREEGRDEMIKVLDRKRETAGEDEWRSWNDNIGLMVRPAQPLCYDLAKFEKVNGVITNDSAQLSVQRSYGPCKSKIELPQPAGNCANGYGPDIWVEASNCQ